MLADILTDFRSALIAGKHQRQMEDALSHGQIKSKQWLIDTLSPRRYHLQTVYVLCNWYGVLPLMLFDSGFFHITRCLGFDIDPKCVAVADAFNGHHLRDSWKYKSVTADITEMDFSVTHFDVHREDGSVAPQIATPNTIINCGCEHVKKEWLNRVPPGKLVVLQSTNDVVSDGHINPMQDLLQFHSEYPLAETLFAGELELESGHKRFMLIGRT